MTTTCKPTASTTVGFISLGCAKNLVDSQTMAGFLLSENLTLAPSPEEADVVVVNTCAFIDEAREESREAILAACELKRDGLCSSVVVAGCMPQRYRDTILESMPEVDAFIGLDQLDQIGGIVRNLSKSAVSFARIGKHATRLFEPRIPVVFSGGSYAYLKIAEGCNHGCSFCAIPGIRGHHRSRGIKQIVNEAETLLKSGFRELDIISQDTTSYGKDLKADVNLAALLKELGSIRGEFWIRLLYAYPTLITDELLEIIASTPQICHYLDIPIQHSDPAILKAMGRAGTTRAVHVMAERIRSYIPDVALRTTCLVGFPGETDQQFHRLVDFVKETRFDNLGVFVYSPEENTKAYAMEDVPSPAVAEERRNAIMEAQREVVDEQAQSLIGKEETFVLDCPGDDPGTWMARSYRRAPEADGLVHIKGVPGTGKTGAFIHARYTAQDEYDMKGIFVKLPGKTTWRKSGT